MNKKNCRFFLPLVCIPVAIIMLTQPALAQSDKQAFQTEKRTLLIIPYPEREHLLHVMRNNLANLGRLINAMADDDFKTVESIANAMSLNEKKARGLTKRGNPAFTAMGVQFHGRDTLALKHAAESKDRKRTLRAMSGMVASCVACHATFRVMEWPENKTYAQPEPTSLMLPPGVVIHSNSGTSE